MLGRGSLVIATVACLAVSVVVWPAAADLQAGLSQTPSPLAAFDAVSIKPTVNGIISGDGAARIGWFPDGLYRVDDGSVSVLLHGAFPGITDVIGLPSWTKSQHYDVEAKPERPATPDERPRLLRRMLEDRFRLVAHLEDRKHETYALRMARTDGILGPQIHRAPVDCSGFFKLPAEEQAKVPATTNAGPRCGTRVSRGELLSGGITMTVLAANLRGQAGRVVIDETGLIGDFEVTLNTSDDASIFTALREQLGLTLEPSEALLPVLVVDRIVPPAEN